jgi:hypothetical protein
MKRMIFSMLTLLILSVASMNAQVRIGGTTDPHGSAVLDLNENDDADAGTLGLALPRVALTATDAIPSGMSAPATGLLVYNTNPGLGEGIYYWSGGAWVKIPNSSGTTYAADGSSLSLSGSTFSIKDNGVTTGKIANTNVTLDKLASNSVNSAKIVDLSIETGDLKDGAVTSAKIADLSIATADLANNAVTVAKLPAGSGSASTYLNGTGGWTAPTDNNTTYAAGAGLNLSGTTFSIPDGGVTSAKIADLSIATADLANGAVTAAKLNQMEATQGQVLRYDGTKWAPAAASSVTYEGVVGASGAFYALIVPSSASSGLYSASYPTGATSGSFIEGIMCWGVSSAAMVPWVAEKGATTFSYYAFSLAGVMYTSNANWAQQKCLFRFWQ